MRTPGKQPPYEPGTCAKRLTHYMYHQQNRPQDNNIEYWRNFVNEYFAPSAKKRWCVSLYGNGRQTTGVFPQDVWHCEICNRKPGRGFETTVEVLPRLCQIKYASGTLEELLYVDMPRESQNSSGQIVLDYTKAIQESVFEQLRVVREGHLRIVFNQDLKIASWEFCARRHEELIPRRSIIPQVNQLGAVAQKYQSSVLNSPGLSSQDMQNNCNSFVACARQLAKALEVPLVNDLGYTKRYVRCLQIAEVVNCMKDLIDYSRQTGSGPIESLHKFPRRGPSGISSPQPQQQPEQQQPVPQNSNHSGQHSAPTIGVQVSASGNGDATSNNSLNGAPSTSAPSSSSVVGLLQGSINCRQDQPTSSSNGLYNSGTNISVSKANSTNSTQSNIPASNSSMMPAPQHTSQLNSPTMSSNLPPIQTLTSRPQEPESNESQSSVQRILQEMMMTSHMNGVGPVGSDMKRANAINPGLNGVNSLVGNPMTNNSGINGMGFGAMGGLGQSMRSTMGNNVMAMNGRTGMNHSAHDLTQLSHQQQQRDIGNQLLGGLRAANSFNNLQYDWKTSQ
uniref:Transcriptional corepressor SEUSS n=1 Tax=Arundo donax TaxID=35708 RepID=A0A0A9EC09_ARUDO